MSPVKWSGVILTNLGLHGGQSQSFISRHYRYRSDLIEIDSIEIEILQLIQLNPTLSIWFVNMMFNNNTSQVKQHQLFSRC